MIGKHPIKPSGGGEKMKKKMFTTAIVLLTVVLLTTPLIGTVAASTRGGRRRCDSQEFNVKIYGGSSEVVWERAIPKSADLIMDDGIYTDPKLQRVETKAEFAVIDGNSDPPAEVVVMIGDEEFSTADDEIAFGADYSSKIYNPTDGANDYAKYEIKWWITFNPATTGIDGSIIIISKGINPLTNTPTSGGGAPQIGDYGKGYGTGDLAGVKTYDNGFLVFDPLGAGVWVEHQGEIKCWPKYFNLLCSGHADESTGTVEEFFEDDVLVKRIISDRAWITGPVVELTVGDEVFTPTTAPFSVDWTTTFNAEIIFNEAGTDPIMYYINLVDVVTVYEDDVEIATLVLDLDSTVDLATVPPTYSGTVLGYGTGALKGVHVTGTDIGLINPDEELFLRIGRIRNWPKEITND